VQRYAGDFRRRFSAVFVSSFFTSLLVASSAWADSIQGRVLDPAGRPVAAATVLVLQGSTVVGSVTTTQDGSYGPLALSTGHYDVLVSAPGLRLAPTAVTIAAARPVTLELRLSLSAVQESIVVSAAQVDTTQSRTASSTTVVTANDLVQTQSYSVADAMRLVPGFNVTTTGNIGSQTALLPRGGEADYTLVLVDGVPQNAFGGAFDAAHLATVNVERMEVVRGPQSALYGSGAIGGIIHLITKNGGEPRASASFEGGGYGVTAGTAGASASRGRFSVGGGLDWLRSDGDSRTFDSIGGKVSNDDYERLSGSGSIGWSNESTARVRLDVRGGRNERGFPGPYGSDPEGLFGGLDTISRGRNRHTSVGVNTVLTPTASIEHRLQLTWAKAHGEFVSPFDIAGPSEDETGRLTGRYQLDLRAHGTGLSFGAEALREDASSSFITDDTFTTLIPIERSNVGLFAEARPSLGDSVFITVGVRAERLSRARLSGDGTRPEFGPSIVWSTNPKVALAWLARTGSDTSSVVGDTKLRGGAGTGIKAPTAFDIAFTDNPDLRPERSRSMDIGIEQALVASRVVLDATWFHNSYDDLIVSISQPLATSSRYKTDNVANARASGLEVGASWRPSAALSARASWTWLDTEILGVDSLPDVAPALYQVGDQLLRRPRHVASVELNWTSSRVSVFALVNQRGTMRDIEPNWASSVFTNPGRVNTTFGASLQLTRGLQAYGRLTNAFDRQYEDVLGFPAMGRSASIGLRVAAGH
jgi:outer membrane cobalamin receptor